MCVCVYVFRPLSRFSHGHVEQGLIKSAIIALRFLLLLKDKFEVTDEVLEHDSLVVLDSVGVK